MRYKWRQEPTGAAKAAEEAEIPLDVLFGGATVSDTPKKIGERQVLITDRLPFNVVKDADDALWDKYRSALLTLFWGLGFRV
jgi:hypothetical protein